MTDRQVDQHSPGILPSPTPPILSMVLTDVLCHILKCFIQTDRLFQDASVLSLLLSSVKRKKSVQAESLANLQCLNTGESLEQLSYKCAPSLPATPSYYSFVSYSEISFKTDCTMCFNNFRTNNYHQNGDFTTYCSSQALRTSISLKFPVDNALCHQD